MHFMACGPDCEPVDDYPVAEGFQPFRSDLPTGMWATEDYLDMDVLDQINLGNEVENAESRIASGHVARTAIDSFVVDRDYAIEIALDHIEQGWDFSDQGPIDALTVEEQEKVADWFENQWGGFGDRFYNDWHRSVDEALEAVLTETRRR